jgi:hypothetical protein
MLCCASKPTATAQKKRQTPVRSVLTEGVPPASTVELPVCSEAYGHALPKLMRALHATLVVVSTPERGGPPDAATGEYSVPVMSGLERLQGYLFPDCIGAYDFKGSAAAQDCAAQVPDRDIDPVHGWSQQEVIKTTQWFRYWMGRVRSALATVALRAEPLAGKVDIDDCGDTGGGLSVAPRTRTVFAVSLSGGAITQTEKEALPGLISGTVADLSTRDLDIGAVNIHWLHFEDLDSFLKCLQGYGGIDFGGAMNERSNFDLPGEFVDGDYKAEHDLLKHVPGALPEARRAFLLSPPAPSQAQLDTQLLNAIRAKSAPRVRELLGLATDDTPLPAAQRPALCADPNSCTSSTGDGMFSFAAMKFNLAAVRSLLAASADPRAVRDDGSDALQMAVEAGQDAPYEAGAAVRERVEATIELVARAVHGVSYAELVASLVEGAAVTYRDEDIVEDTGGDTAGTVVEVGKDGGDTLLHSAVKVRGASTGQLSRWCPAATCRPQAGGGGSDGALAATAGWLAQ